MNKNLWAKTILSLWGKLPRAIRNLDKNIDWLVDRTLFARGDTLKELEELRLLILRKKNLEYICQIIRECYKELDIFIRRLLYEKHIRCKSFRALAEEFHISLRTAFRRYDRLVDGFSAALISLGYDDEYLFAELGNDDIVSDELFRQLIASRGRIANKRAVETYGIDKLIGDNEIILVTDNYRSSDTRDYQSNSSHLATEHYDSMFN